MTWILICDLSSYLLCVSGIFIASNQRTLLNAWMGQTGEIRTIAAARPGLLNKCPCLVVTSWWLRSPATALPCCWGSGLELQEPKLQRLGWEWKCCSSRMQLLLLTTDVIRQGSGCFFLVLTVPGNVRVGIHSKALNNKFRTAQRKKGVYVCVHFW